MFLAIHEITKAIVTVIGSECQRRASRRIAPKILFTFFFLSLTGCVLSDGGLQRRGTKLVG